MIWLATIAALAFAQSVANSIVSRARNRDSKLYHAGAAVFSNTVFYLTFRELVLADMSLAFATPYIVGTVAGSLFGASISMRIERAIGARADAI
jgi:hypothetical protein